MVLFGSCRDVAMNVSRRNTFKLVALASAAACTLSPTPVAAVTPYTRVLGNGLRAHLISTPCGYVSLSLILRFCAAKKLCISTAWRTSWSIRRSLARLGC